MNELTQLRNLMESVSSSKFQKITFEKFERLMQSSYKYQETAIDGRRVIAAYTDNNNCLGIYYNKAKFASVNPKHIGDALEYSEADPHRPYGDS